MTFRYLFLTALLAACFLGVAAQDKNTTFDIVLSPTIAGRFVSEKPSFENNETVTVMFDAGVMVKVIERGRWQLQTGAVFSRKGFSYGEVTFRDEDNMPLGTAVMRHRMDFLEIPVRVLLRVSANSRNFLVGGIMNDILLKNAIMMDGEVVPEKAFYSGPAGARQYNVGLQVGYAHYFSATKKFSFGLEPNMKCQLLRAQRTTAIKRYFFTIGLSAKFRLKV